MLPTTRVDQRRNPIERVPTEGPFQHQLLEYFERTIYHIADMQQTIKPLYDAKDEVLLGVVRECDLFLIFLRANLATVQTQWLEAVRQAEIGRQA